MKNVLITGCNRGIGLEFVKQLSLMGVNLIATYRDRNSSQELFSIADECSNIELLQLDVSSENSMVLFQSSLMERPVDVFINNAGVMGSGSKNFGSIASQNWLEVLNVNTVAPLILTQKLYKNFLNGNDKKLIYVSSKMGSIEDNNGGSSYVYRSSKTALNQVVKSLSVDLSPKGFTVIAVHPGWVQTDMGGVNALIDTKTSVSGLLNVIQNLKNSDNGNFLNYDGEIIPW